MEYGFAICKKNSQNPHKTDDFSVYFRFVAYIIEFKIADTLNILFVLHDIIIRCKCNSFFNQKAIRKLDNIKCKGHFQLSFNKIGNINCIGHNQVCDKISKAYVIIFCPCNRIGNIKHLGHISINNRIGDIKCLGFTN